MEYLSFPFLLTDLPQQHAGSIGTNFVFADPKRRKRRTNKSSKWDIVVADNRNVLRHVKVPFGTSP